MRILLKISGEALKWKKDFWFEEVMVEKVALMIKQIKDMWIWLAIVVWGWNIYRGWTLIEAWVNPADSHNLSMLSTVFNWVVLKNFLEKIGVDSIVMDSNWINFVSNYYKDSAIRYINKGVITIFTGWTWNPYFSTDTAWVLRALELDCDFMIKATRVDWIYDCDPEKNKNAKFFEEISYHNILADELNVMDLAAIDIAKNNNLVLKVANLFKPGAIMRVIKWEKEGTTIIK